MKGAFSLNNLLVGTARPPDRGRRLKNSMKNWEHSDLEGGVVGHSFS